MPIAVIAPIRERLEDFEEIEKVILRFFREEIYGPLLAEIGADKGEIQNAKKPTMEEFLARVDRDMTTLAKAIESGQIRFYRGRFTGKFNSKLSRALRSIGAEWDRKQGSFLIPQSKLPPAIKQTVAVSESRFQRVAERMTEKLASISPDKLAEKLDLTKLFDKTIFKVEKDIQKTLKNISIAPQLSPEARARVASEYTKTLQLPIKEFIQKETVELRERIQERAFAGYRYETLVKEIQKSYGVSQRKAKFLARQETSLLMTKFKQVRYQEAGSNEYIWGCVKMPHQKSPKSKPVKGDVRYWHGKNEGKTFKWSEGARVNEAGEKKNPGQDYNCRCFARPIVRF